jgi:hypothetical protein
MSIITSPSHNVRRHPLGYGNPKTALHQELDQERGLKTQHKEAIKEKKPLQCKGYQWHARRDSNPQPSDP